MFNHKTPDSHTFLSGGGEMGKLMRAKDWSATAVGDPSIWPQSLRTTLSIILHSKFPMFLFWGREHICFYNDAYRPSLGQNGKHPESLGSRGEDVWPEIWNDIYPLIQQVMSGGEATWAEDELLPIYRNGALEDVYWTYSYSSVTDETGAIAGVFVTCTETTDKISTHNYLEENRNQLQFAIESAELGTWDYNPATNKFTANKRLKQWFGLPDDSEIELDYAIGVISDNDKQRTIAAIEKALDYNSGGHYAIEYTINNPITKQDIVVFVKGKAWFNEHKEPYRFYGIMQDVTKQVAARKKLAESESHFRNLVLQSPIPMTIIRGKDFIVETANAVMFRDVWRKKEEDVIGKPILKVFPELMEQKYPELLNKVYDTGIPHTETESVAYVEGDDGMQKFYLDFEYAPLLDTDQTISGIIITVNNVTEKVEARLKAEESEQRLNLVIDASELGTWELNMQTDEMKYSDRFVQMFGFNNAEEIVHDQFVKRLHPDDMAARAAAFEKAYKTGTLNYESRIIWSNGIQRWMEVKGRVFMDDKGAPLSLIGTTRDTTHEKYHQQELEDRERKFRLLANAMPQLVWTASAYGDINYYNQSVYSYSGLSELQLLKNGWLQLVHPDDMEQSLEAWNYAVESGKDFIIEHRFKNVDGEYRWQLTRAIPQKDPLGNIRMWVGTSTDIQEIKELDQQKDLFIGMASHELKTPITTVKGYVQLLQDIYQESNDSFLQNSLEKMHKQIETLTDLISDLLDLSKIKAGNLHYNKENFAVSNLVEEVVNSIRHINPHHTIEFNKETNAIISGDRNRVGQVLINFLTNAIKYSPESKLVKVVTREENGYAIVSVEDEGIGIIKADQEKIFERFYRVEGKNEKTFPGFGIGLFISAEIVKKHSGKIGVSSEQGKGATFYFSIPIVNS